MSNGLVTQIIGAVIDVEFEKNNIPQVYEAIKITDTGTVLEVQQQLGDGIVRAIAMGTTEGLKRGLTAERTNAPISVPVGEKTLGRIMDVLGNPIDEKGPIGEQERACRFTVQPPTYDGAMALPLKNCSRPVLRLSILICPFAKGR